MNLAEDVNRFRLLLSFVYDGGCCDCDGAICVFVVYEVLLFILLCSSNIEDLNCL